MHLYCMRHGEAHAISSLHQFQSLTPRGMIAVQSIAQFLKNQSINIEKIIHSGIMRAEQTAHILKVVFPHLHGTSIDKNLSGRESIDCLIQTINLFEEEVLLVSHLPTIDLLIQKLVFGKIQNSPLINFQPATLVCLNSCANNQWIIDWIVNPSLV